MIGRIDCGGGPVDCSDWMRVCGVVDFSRGGGGESGSAIYGEHSVTDLQLMPHQ